MYTAKHARLYKHKVHDGQAYIFYMDIRSTGKGYEEFIQHGMEEEGLLYLRGRVSRIHRDGDKVAVWGVDTLTGRKVEILADMVVLATAITARKEAKDLARKLGIRTDDYGFLSELQRKLRPVETDVEGILIAGCAQGPKDIADAVAHVQAAKVLRGHKVHPNVSFVVIPASRKVYERAMDEGILQVIIKAGANVESSNCGPCFGSHMGVLSKNAQMISSSNRNYQGRMGSRDARIFLASPATVAASAIEGKIADPRKYL